MVEQNEIGINVPELRFLDENGETYPDWNGMRLEEIGKIITGKTPKTSELALWNGKIHFITPTDISNKKYLKKTERTVTEQNNMQILSKGTIVYTCIASIGKMALILYPSITNQQINSIIVDKKYNSEFVYYVLLHITPYIKSTQANTTLPIINKSDFSKLKIIIPSLKEQQKIASFLSSVDTKIEKLSKKVDLLTEYKKGVMQKLFAKDESCEKKALSSVIFKNIKSQIQVNEVKENTEGNIPFFTSGENVYKTNKSLVSNKNIFMSTGGVASIKFFDGDASYSTDTLSFSSKEQNILYIYYILLNSIQEINRKLFFGSGLAHLDKKALNKTIISIPSLKKQTKIANFLSAIDKKIELTKKQVELTKEFKKGLLQKMFV